MNILVGIPALCNESRIFRTNGARIRNYIVMRLFRAGYENAGCPLLLFTIIVRMTA